MENLPTSEFQRQDLGILLLEESITDVKVCLDFLRATHVSEMIPDTMYVEWTDHSSHRERGVDLIYSKVQYNEHNVCLIRFPEALPRTFSLQDLRFPVKIIGAVVITSGSLSRLQTGDTIRADPALSGLAWAEMSGLPIVVVVASHSAIPLDELSSLLSINAHISLLHYQPGSFNEDQVHRIILKVIEEQEGYSRR